MGLIWHHTPRTVYFFHCFCQHVLHCLIPQARQPLLLSRLFCGSFLPFLFCVALCGLFLIYHVCHSVGAFCWCSFLFYAGSVDTIERKVRRQWKSLSTLINKALLNFTVIAAGEPFAADAHREDPSAAGEGHPKQQPFYISIGPETGFGHAKWYRDNEAVSR